MHWRVRAHLQDRPGALAAVAGSCGDSQTNILALQVYPTHDGVVDELIVHAPEEWTADDVKHSVHQAGARDPHVVPCTPHALQDPVVRHLRAALAVTADPASLQQQLGQLLEASPSPGEVDGHELVLDDDQAPPVRLARTVPFTATEHARAAALRQFAALPRDAPPPAAAEDQPGPGETVLRPGTTDDVAGLIAMHARCSAETTRRRYHTAIPHLPARLPHALLTPDHGHSLVATHGPDLIGIATFARGHDGEHEVGLQVEDRWQRHGIGTRLLHALARQAAHQHIPRLVCLVQPDNNAVPATIRRAGFHPRLTMTDGLLQATIPLARPTRDAHTNKTPMPEVTHGLVPLLHQRIELREVSPVATMIDHAVRGGA